VTFELLVYFSIWNPD